MEKEIDEITGGIVTREDLRIFAEYYMRYSDLTTGKSVLRGMIVQSVTKSRQDTLNEVIEKMNKMGKTWGGYDDGNVVDDKEAFAYNNALSDLEQLINDMKGEQDGRN